MATDKRIQQDSSKTSPGYPAKSSAQDAATLKTELDHSELRAMVNMVRQKLHELQELQNEKLSLLAEMEATPVEE